MNGKRIEAIDVARGILIFLVILGHSPISPWLCGAINSFHMAAFFCLSGLTFSFRGDWGNLFGRKTKGILIPYIEFSLILLLYFGVKDSLLSGGVNSISLQVCLV